MTAGVVLWLACAWCVSIAEHASASTVPASSCTQTFATQANPAAGANFTITPTAGHTWEITSLRFKFTSSSQVASRTLLLQYLHGATIELQATIGQIAASSVIEFDGAGAGQLSPVAQGTPNGTTTYYDSTLPPILLTSGESIASSTAFVQTSDQYSALTFSYCDVGAQSVNVGNSPTVAISGTVPVSIAGTVGVTGSVGIVGTVNAAQSGTWNVNSTAQCATTTTTSPGVQSCAVNVANSPTVNVAQSGTWNVNATAQCSGTTTTTSGVQSCAVNVANTPHVFAAQEGSWPVSVSGGISGTFSSATCPGAASTTSTSSSTTTTTTIADAACAVKLASFSGDGLAVPVAAGLIGFAALAMFVVSWRFRRA